MPTPTVITPVTVMPNAVRYPLLSISNRLDAAGNSRTTVQLILQRSQKSDAGVWTDDPTPIARKQKQIPDLVAYAAANPAIGALINTAWDAIDAVVAAINVSENLV